MMDDRHFTYFVQWLDHTMRNIGPLPGQTTGATMWRRISAQANDDMARYSAGGDMIDLIMADALERYLAILAEDGHE